ncbi:hypothetical protein vseg_003978 [Gypsophila vaccaria]
MESLSTSKTEEAFNIENGAINDGQDITPPTAHSVGHDSWQQVGLMLATCFNCGWILSFSNLMLVPLGWAWGIPSLVLVGLFTAYANWLLAGFHFIDGQRFIRYRDMIRHLFGREMYYVTWIAQSAIFILGNMGFILLGGRALKEINLMFSDSVMRLQYFIIITGVAYFIFALIVPNMSAMRLWLGASAVLTFSYTGVLLVAVIIDGKSNNNRDYQVRGSIVDKVLNAFSAISVIIVCNSSGMLPEIQSTLRKPAIKNMRRALAVQFTAGLAVYYGVSIVGYWAYGSEVSDYLPKQISGPKWAKVLINLAVFLQNIISQHLFLQPVHEALDTKFLKLDEVTAAIPFMGDFINLLGSFTLILLTFIFPSMIFIKVKGKTARRGQKAWHCTIVFISSLLAAATTVSAVRLIVINVKNYQLFANQ